MRYPEIKQNFYEVFSGIHRSFLKLNCENLKQTHQWRRKTQRLLEWSLCGRRRGPVFFSSKGHFWDSAADGKRNNVVMRLFEDSLRSGVTRQRLLHWRQLILSHKERGAVVYFTKLEPGQGGVGGNEPAAELLRSETPSGEQSDLDPSKPNQNEDNTAAGLPTGDSNLLIGEGNFRKSDGSDTSCRSVMYVKLTAVDQNGEAVEICGATWTHRHTTE